MARTSDCFIAVERVKQRIKTGPQHLYFVLRRAGGGFEMATVGVGPPIHRAIAEPDSIDCGLARVSRELELRAKEHAIVEPVRITGAKRARIAVEMEASPDASDAPSGQGASGAGAE